MRARNIKPGFWTNELLGSLPDSVRLLFIGLWCLADRKGKLEDRPERIRHAIFGYGKTTGKEVDQNLEKLKESGFIRRYQVQNLAFILIANFNNHQTPHPHEKPSKIPDPVTSRDMSLHVIECQADILNPDILNPPIVPQTGDEIVSSVPKETTPEAGAPTPHDLIELWNLKAHPNLPRVRDLTETRKRTIRARLVERPDQNFWIDILTRINQSQFLTGENPNSMWRANFDWMIKPANLTKISEGVYDKRR